MKTKKLIVENTLRDYQVVTETNASGANVIKLTGIFMEAETLNNNNRMYHLEEMISECNKFQEVIKGGRALAELEHPEEIFINPDRVCARILKLQQSPKEEKQFLGEAVVLAPDQAHGIIGTPCGTILASLIQYGTKVGWSTRGLGEPNDGGYVDDFQLVTIDCVLDPSIGYMADSTKESAFVNGVCESRNYIVDQFGEVVECQTNKLNKALAKLPKGTDAKNAHLMKAVQEYLKSI